MEYSAYLIAFLLLLVPISAICISAMDNSALKRYEGMIIDYDQRVSNLEYEMQGLKPQQEIEERAQLPAEIITPLLEPQNIVNLLDTFTRNLPKKDPALVELAASNSCSNMLTASCISLASIIFNVFRFVLLNFNVVFDFVVRLSSYALSVIAGFVMSGNWIGIISAVLAFVPAVIAVLPYLIPMFLEFLAYLPQILVYFSIVMRNIGTFFVTLPIR
jgi:hypothetical protein